MKKICKNSKFSTFGQLMLAPLPLSRRFHSFYNDYFNSLSTESFSAVYRFRSYYLARDKNELFLRVGIPQNKIPRWEFHPK